MLIAYPAPFQLFAFFGSMPSLRHLPDTIREPLFRAGACALRVGIYPIVGHADRSSKSLSNCYLWPLHAQADFSDGHVIRLDFAYPMYLIDWVCFARISLSFFHLSFFKHAQHDNT
jgi:hypothetical protein